MNLDDQQLRIEGIYRQNERGEYMQRVKLVGGILSVAQARALVELGARYGSGVFHLTTRGSIEFHGLKGEDLPAVHRGLAAVGLFSRGACGGAVRGISCSSSFGPGFGRTQVLLRHFLKHFSGNPHFEGLPKKFKIAIEAGYERSRHLIQDLALVLVEEDGENSRYDVWLAGGLGREPQAGFLYADRVPEAELLPLTESIVEVYREWGEKGRRLKTLLNTLGEEELRRRIAESLSAKHPAKFFDAFAKPLLPNGRGLQLPLNIFAGELQVQPFGQLISLAEKQGCEWLLVTPDQDLEILVAETSEAFEQALSELGFALNYQGSALRICPGNHECRMGLCATRDLANSLIDEFGDKLNGRAIAISGCRNSCAQPQLAEIGIIASKLKSEDGSRVPFYDLYNYRGAGLGESVRSGMTEKELIVAIDKYLSGK